MHIPWVGVIAAVLGTVGCVADGGSFGRPAIPDYRHFEHASEGRHITLYWNCLRTGSGALRLEGVGLNRWEPIPPRFLEFALSRFDAEGRVLAGTRGVAQGVDLLQGFPAPFRLELEEQAEEARVDLLYRYQYVDDSFDFDRLSRILPSYATYHVRDACGIDAHRNRP